MAIYLAIIDQYASMLVMKEYVIPRDEEKALLAMLQKKSDANALRIKRYLAMPDLSRTPENPLHEIVARASKVKSLQDFDVIEIPEIVSTDILFDLFNMPPGHPARSPSDTYYLDEAHVLRTHDTVFWYYYLNHPDVKKRIANKETLGTICYGKVYRKDEIDSRHMNVFHQFGGLLVGPDDTIKITPEDLKNTLSEIARAIFGNINFRFYDHNFPYTDPSFEMEAEINGQWVEMLGCGMARKSVLKNFGLEGYHGWAFGFGLERLAIASMELPDIRLLWSDDLRVTKQLKLGTKYKEVSKYPPIVRDISFIVQNDFVPNNYFDLIREIVGEMIVEEVKLIDKYEDEKKFGKGKLSYTYRIVYRSRDKTLTNAEVDALHKKLEEETKKTYGAEIR